MTSSSTIVADAAQRQSKRRRHRRPAIALQPMTMTTAIWVQQFGCCDLAATAWLQFALFLFIYRRAFLEFYNVNGGRIETIGNDGLIPI